MRALTFKIFVVLVIGKPEVTTVHALDSREQINVAFFVCNHSTSTAFCRKDKQICDTSSGTARCVCVDGWGGKRCEEDIDECIESYPCPGIKNVNSICVDHDPPIRFECQCIRGYKPVYSESSSSKTDAFSKLHPLDCIKANICDNKPCHPDATCLESSSEDGFTCLCNKGLTGDGIESCSVIPSASPSAMIPMTTPTTYPIRKDIPPNNFCMKSSDCEISNTDCVLGKCTCQEGFVRRKLECININECKRGYMNSCHRNADCFDTIGSYECQCKDGFHDRDTSSLPGTDCIQTNECIVDGAKLCNLETEVCIDRRPPLKWECIEKTPAPTKLPTRRYDPPVPRCERERKLLDSSSADAHVERYLTTDSPAALSPVTSFPVTPAPVTDTPNNAPTC